MRQWISGGVAAVVLMTGVVSAQQEQAPRSSRPVVLQRILVKVNGAVFTKTELEELQIEALQARNQKELSQLDLQNDASLRAMLIEVTPQILDTAVDQLIIIQRARDLGYTLSDERFKAHVASIKQENQLNDEQFAAAMKSQGLTMETLRAQIERMELRNAIVQNEIMRNVTLTEEEARQYYRAHPDEFLTAPMVTLREIFVSVPTEVRDGATGSTVSADEAALAKITQARERALKGEDFAALVNEYSESGSKANGGLIGPINLNELADTLKQRLSALKTGEIDQPMRTPKGYQLLKVESRTDAEPRPFDQVRNEIGNKVFQERGEVMMAAYLDDMREQAIIEWKDDELKQMYEQYRASKKKAQN
jgi:parvulin-like peptidyl-prolyl isomerase